MDHCIYGQEFGHHSCRRQTLMYPRPYAGRPTLGEGVYKLDRTARPSACAPSNHGKTAVDAGRGLSRTPRCSRDILVLDIKTLELVGSHGMSQLQHPSPLTGSHDPVQLHCTPTASTQE